MPAEAGMLVGEEVISAKDELLADTATPEQVVTGLRTELTSWKARSKSGEPITFSERQRLLDIRNGLHRLLNAQTPLSPKTRIELIQLNTDVFKLLNKSPLKAEATTPKPDAQVLSPAVSAVGPAPEVAPQQPPEAAPGKVDLNQIVQKTQLVVKQIAERLQSGKQTEAERQADLQTLRDLKQQIAELMIQDKKLTQKQIGELLALVNKIFVTSMTREATPEPVAAKPQEKKAGPKALSETEKRAIEQKLLNGSLEEIAALPGMDQLRQWLTRYGKEKQHTFHDFNLRDHVAEVVRRTQVDAKAEKLLVLAAALHDIGKVGAAEANRLHLDPQKRGREPRHAQQSVLMATKMMDEIAWLTPQEKQTLLFLIKHHESLGNMAIYKDEKDQQKRQEVFIDGKFRSTRSEVAKAVGNESDLDLLLHFTMADIGSVKINGQLLTPDVLAKLDAAWFETKSEYALLRSVRPDLSEKEREKAKIDSAYYRQMGKISRREALVDPKTHESVFQTSLPTHRCSVQAALGILESKIMVSHDKSRGINFRPAGLSADYGFITFIGRGNDVWADRPDRKIPVAWPPGNSPSDSKHPLNIFDMAGPNKKSKADDLYGEYKPLLQQKPNGGQNGFADRYTPQLIEIARQKSQDFHEFADIPACNSAQLNIGARDSELIFYQDRIVEAATRMRIQPNEISAIVPTEALRAMIVPRFVVERPVYAKLATLVKQNGIEILVAETGKTAMDYLGESLAYYLNPGMLSGTFRVMDGIGQFVAFDLYQQGFLPFEDYPNRNSDPDRYALFQLAVAKYLDNRGETRLSTKDTHDKEQYALRIILANQQAKIHRGLKIGGTFINCPGAKAYAEEEKCYFQYLAKVEHESALKTKT